MQNPPTNPTEAELMGMGDGEGVTRLRPDWGGLLNVLPKLGHIRAVTQNLVARMAASGIYCADEVTRVRRLHHSIQFVVNLPFWRSAFLKVERSQPGRALKRSLHFFGSDGSLVHSLHLTRSSAIDVFEEIVELFACSNRHLEPLVSETQAAPPISLASNANGIAVSRNAVVEIVHHLAQDEIPVSVSVVNGGSKQTHCGLFRKIRKAGGILHASDCGTEIEFSEESIAKALVVKCSSTGEYTEALTLFDTQGREAALIATSRRSGSYMDRRWSEILRQATHPAAA